MKLATLVWLLLAASAPARGTSAEPANEPVVVSAASTADGDQVLIHEVAIGASVAEVWEAVSTARGWMTWAVPVAWQRDDILETSYTSTAQPGDPTTIQQQILASEPGRRLVFRTVKAPDGFPHFAAYREVLCTIELEALGPARTRVRLTSVGYPDSEAGRELAGFFREGNRVSLEQLRDRFASGPIDWSARP